MCMINFQKVVSNNIDYMYKKHTTAQHSAATTTKQEREEKEEEEEERDLSVVRTNLGSAEGEIWMLLWNT